MIEGGLINKWVKEALDKELSYIGIFGGDKGNVVSRRSTSNKPISILQLQAAFFILGIGFLLAFMSLIVEILIAKLVIKD